MRLAMEHMLLVTVEENAVMGGAGSAVNECLAAHGVTIPVINMGLPDRFVEHGSRTELLNECGLNVPAILHAVHKHPAYLRHQPRTGVVRQAKSQ